MRLGLLQRVFAALHVGDYTAPKQDFDVQNADYVTPGGDTVSCAFTPLGIATLTFPDSYKDYEFYDNFKALLEEGADPNKGLLFELEGDQKTPKVNSAIFPLSPLEILMQSDDTYRHLASVSTPPNKAAMLRKMVDDLIDSGAKVSSRAVHELAFRMRFLLFDAFHGPVGSSRLPSEDAFRLLLPISNALMKKYRGEVIAGDHDMASILAAPTYREAADRYRQAYGAQEGVAPSGIHHE